MKKDQLTERINNALEAELCKIYDELGIMGGDISPMDLFEWDRLTDEMATLFQCLIHWNTPEE